MIGGSSGNAFCKISCTLDSEQFIKVTSISRPYIIMFNEWCQGLNYASGILGLDNQDNMCSNGRAGRRCCDDKRAYCNMHREEWPYEDGLRRADKFISTAYIKASERYLRSERQDYRRYLPGIWHFREMLVIIF